MIEFFFPMTNTHRLNRLNWNMSDRRMGKFKISGIPSAIAAAAEKKKCCIFPIRRWWCSIIKMRFGHPSNFYDHCGTRDRFHSTTKNRLTALQWQAEKRFSPSDSWKGANLHNGLTTSEQSATPVWKTLYPIHSHSTAPDTCVILSTPIFVGYVHNYCGQ